MFGAIKLTKCESLNTNKDAETDKINQIQGFNRKV